MANDILSAAMTMTEAASPVFVPLDHAQCHLPACAGREWAHKAIALIEADASRSADTHMIRLPACGIGRGSPST